MSVTFHNTHNPILPLKYHVPDSEAHVMPDGKLYVYGSFDDREDVFCSEEYHVVSTTDMREWTIHDISLTGQEIPWFHDPLAPKYQGIDWSHPTPFIQKMLVNMDQVAEKEKFEKEEEGENPPLLFAPDCIYRDGKYYLYFCMPDDSEGVAISDSPVGPFRNPIQLPCGGIDPAIFIDDDGQAYYYWGQLFSHGVKMNSDMVSFDEKQIVHDLVTEKEHFFHEGSSMRKIGDTYYYVYANIEHGKPTSLGYATSKSPLGPFAYQGVIIDNAACDPASWNNHGSIECMNGQWYVFYHRCSRGVQQYRRLCIEPITIQEDGTIREVKMTSQGAGNAFGPEEKIMAYQACELNGSCYIDVDDTYGEKLTNIEDGDSAVFRYIKSEYAFEHIKIHATGTGKILVLLNGKEAGAVVIQNGVLQREALSAKAGEYELSLKFIESINLEILEIVLLYPCQPRVT